MSKNQYENEEQLALREKNWNPRFVLGKIPKFDAYNDINYLSLGLLKSKLRYQERIKKEDTKTKTKNNERLFSPNYFKSKSHAKTKFVNNKKNSLKNERFPSMRIYLNTNNYIKSKNNKMNNLKNSYNYPYQGTLTSYNVAGSYLFKYNPDYKDKNMNHNYLDYICEEDQEMSDEYYLLKELWEKLGVTENYIQNFHYLLNNKYKDRDELLEMIKEERKQMKQFRIEFMKVLSEINKRESKIKDLKNFIKLYEQVLIKEQRYKNINEEKIKGIEEINKEKIEGDIHECLKSLRIRTINTVNAIKKFKKDYEHLFSNKINIEILKEKYGYNEFYLSKLKNDLDFLRDSAINNLYHFSEKGGDPFLLSISDLCGNLKDIDKFRQVRISEEVLSVAKKFMFFLEQEDVFNMTRKNPEYNKDNMKSYNSYNNYDIIKNKQYNNYYINNDYQYSNEKRMFSNKNYKSRKNDINENLLGNNFKGNIEKEKYRLKEQNEYKNLFFHTQENYNIYPDKKYKKTDDNVNKFNTKISHNNKDNEMPYKTLQTEQNKYTIKGMTSKQLFRQLDKYGKIKNELFPSTNQDKLKEKIKKNIIQNIEDRMKQVEIDFKIKMEEKFKNEENKIKEEEKKIKKEKEKIEKLFKEEEDERKKKEEKYLELEKEIEERKIKDKKINEENEKFERREKELFVKEMQKKFLDEVDERFKKEDERQILFKKEMINAAEKREKERKEKKEIIKHEELEKIKRGDIIVDLREKNEDKENNENDEEKKENKENEEKVEKEEKEEKKKKKKKSEKSESSEGNEEDEEEEEESDEENEENSRNKKQKNKKKKKTSENEEPTSSVNNNKKKNNYKESGNSNDNISEDIEEDI